MNIVIANLASPANPGDQAILCGTLKMIRLMYSEPKVTVVTRAISQKYVYEHFGCQAVANFPNVEHIATDSILGKIINLPKAFQGAAPTEDAIHDADLVFLVGGAYFYSYRPLLPGVTYLSHFSALRWAKKYKKPVIFLPQSYGPFQSRIAKKLFDYAIHSADHVFYREKISGEWLAKEYPSSRNKMSFMHDLALFLEKEDLLTKGAKKDPSRIIGLTIRAWRSGGKDQHTYLKTLKDTLLDLKKEIPLKIRVIVQVQDPKKGEGDEWISQELVRQLNEQAGEEVAKLFTKSPFFSLPEIAWLYHECELMIGMRLHSGLISYITGTPALITGYQHKAEGILQSLGIQDLYLGSFESLTAEKLETVCKSVIHNRSVWTQKIDETLARIRQDIAHTFRETVERIIR